MTAYKLRIQYDGTAYAGWQRQPNAPTVQAAIEHALSRITQRPTRTVAASRTDAGVHALGQIVGFHADPSLSPAEWTRALNSLLPADIAILHTETVSDTFHARYHALAKTYDYHILNQPTRPALDRFRVWHITKPLDLNRMIHATHHLPGRHDCTSFQGSPTSVQNPVCHIQRADWSQEGHLIRFTIQADRFLKHMIRALLGTLVDIGHHKRTPDDLLTIIATRDRRTAGPTAPPQGLYLQTVHYNTQDAAGAQHGATPNVTER